MARAVILRVLVSPASWHQIEQDCSGVRRSGREMVDRADEWKAALREMGWR